MTFPTTRARRTLLCSLVIVWMGFTVLFPVLAPLGREIGLSEFQITSVIAASSLTVFLITPIWGRTSDRWGRKRVLLIGLFGFSLGTLLFNSVLNAGLTGLLVGLPLYLTLIAARVTHAVLMSAAMPASSAYVADITSPAERTRGMGAVGAATNLGSILGPALAGLAVISMLTPLWLIAGIALLNGLFVLLFLPEAPKQDMPHGDHPRLKLTDARLWPILIVGVLLFMGNALVQQTMGFRFQDTLGLDAAATAGVFGTAMMLAAASSLLGQWIFVQRMDFQPYSLMLIAMPMMIVAFSAMALSESRWVLTMAMMIQGFGMGIAMPGFMAAASLAVTPREQGAVAGLSGACPPMGFTIGPLMGGLLYQWQPVSPYVFAAIVFVLLWLAMPFVHGRMHPAVTD